MHCPRNLIQGGKLMISIYLRAVVVKISDKQYAHQKQGNK